MFKMFTSNSLCQCQISITKPELNTVSCQSEIFIIKYTQIIIIIYFFLKNNIGLLIMEHQTSLAREKTCINKI